MILLLGGTSEANPVATGLAERGYHVLASQISDVSLPITPHSNIRIRSGPLDTQQMAQLVQRENVQLIVDVTHPYATGVHVTAQQVADQLGIACLRYVRPRSVSRETQGVELVGDHDEAARVAAAMGRPILLTTGSRNLSVYVRAAGQAGVPLYARVLDDEAAVKACYDAGLKPDHVIAGRGPFSEAQNQALIHRLGAGVLVTKDGGEAGGVPAKLRAARAENCHVLVVRRPAEQADTTFDCMTELFTAVSKYFQSGGAVFNSKKSQIKD